MNYAPLLRFAERLRGGLSATSDVLARLSFWRFVFLCLLLLAAAGIASNVFFEKSRHSHFPTKVGKQQADTDASSRQETKEPVEVRIDANGIAIRRGKTAGNDGSEGVAPITPKENSASEAAKKVAPTDDEDWASQAKVEANKPPLEEIVLLLIVAMIVVRLVTNAKRQAEARASVAEDKALCESLSRQLAESRLQAMQAQVEPHFLFNTLAAVEHLIETDPPRAAVMQRNLIGYLRSVLPNLRRSESTLGRESEICRHYLEILHMRMDERLRYQIDIPAGLESAQLPPLMLQSLVENAIRHGIEPKADGGQVRLSAEIAHGRLVILVDDTGVGFGAAPASRHPNGGLGLSSIRERLQALFGKNASLTISTNVPQGTRARLELPYAVANTADSPDCR